MPGGVDFNEMNRFESVSRSNVGFKRFFSNELLAPGELSVCGIGIRERMQPVMIERPHGTGDFLIMLFHDSVVAGNSAAYDLIDKPDMMMVWPPGKEQYYGNLKQRFVHSWIHCDGKRIRRIFRLAKIPILKPFPVPSVADFQQCLFEVHRELVTYRHPDIAIIGNLLENCFRAISRSLGDSAENAQVREKLLSVRRLIASVPSQVISLSEMAALAGMSVSYFCAQFKAAFGLSPIECLIQHRLHRAAHMLANRNLSVTEIAVQTGYNDMFHFSKAFKKQFGFGPREMRKRLSDGKMSA